MLQHVLSQLASFSTNSVNNNLIKHSDDGSKLVITSIQKIMKYIARFFDCMNNHILEGLYLDTIPKFTPEDANPKYKEESLKVVSMIATIGNGALAISNKSKPNASPPGTPAKDRKIKKQKLKPAAGTKNFTKAGLFHCADGTPTSNLFPSGLSKPLCGYFCFHNKKCSKPNQACKFNHIGKWDKIPVEDQAKILAHCHLFGGKKVWPDADTFAKHRATIPDKFLYLLGNLKDPKVHRLFLPTLKDLVFTDFAQSKFLGFVSVGGFISYYSFHCIFFQPYDL
jgi:hypothetical protein